MADMEDKFQEILGNEQAMSQIMSIAQSLGGGDDSESGSDTFDLMESLPAPMPNLGGMGDLAQMLGGLDPKYLAMGMRVVGAYKSQHRSIEFVRAVEPFLKNDRSEMVNRLSKATRWARVATSIVEIVQETRAERVEKSETRILSQTLEVLEREEGEGNV